jgi:hypothetical protein
VTVAGWGATSFGGGGSSVLLKSDVVTIDVNDCAMAFQDLFALPDNVICATTAACDVSRKFELHSSVSAAVKLLLALYFGHDFNQEIYQLY